MAVCLWNSRKSRVRKPGSPAVTAVWFRIRVQEKLRMRVAAARAAVLGCLCLGGSWCAGNAQQPLLEMPYSPSLDLSSLDRSVDPCVDFYKFTCGGWQKKNPIPADRASWSVYAKLGNDNEQFLWGILEADAKATDRTAVQQKVGDYFAACMNTTKIDALGV